MERAWNAAAATTRDQRQVRRHQNRLTATSGDVQPSMISVPGARAFVLSEEATHSSADAFMIGREFAHLHPASDGSLHTMLPPDLARTVEQQGWGEQHPVARMGLIPPTAMMVEGPRDEAELEVVWDLLRASHAFATGTS